MAEWLCRGLQILVPEFDSRFGLHLLVTITFGVMDELRWTEVSDAKKALTAGRGSL